MNSAEQLQERIGKTDPERLEGYLRMFDRILLYNLATQVIPPEGIKDLIDFWEKVIKKHIDTDCQKFTKFLQETPQGRLACLSKEQPDGEDMRLRFLDAFNLAHEIISSNIRRPEEDFSS